MNRYFAWVRYVSPMLLLAVFFSLPVLVVLIQEHWGQDAIPAGPIQSAFPFLILFLLVVALLMSLIHLAARRRVWESLLALVLISLLVFIVSGRLRSS